MGKKEVTIKHTHADGEVITQSRCVNDKGNWEFSQPYTMLRRVRSLLLLCFITML